MSRIPRPSPAMCVACSALVLAAGGTSYAAAKLPASSVGTPQLKNRAVTSAKLKNHAVTRSKLQPDSVNGDAIAAESIEGAHVKKNSLTGSEVDESSLAPVPNALSAGVGMLSYIPGTLPLPSGMAATGHQDCPAGLNPIAGGARVSDPTNMYVIDSYPQGRGWTANVANPAGFGDGSYTIYTVCAQAGPGAGTVPKASKPQVRKRFRVTG